MKDESDPHGRRSGVIGAEIELILAAALADSDETLVRQLLDSDHPWLDGISYESLTERTWQRLHIPPGYRPHVDAPPETPDGRLRLGRLAYQPAGESQDGSRGEYPLALISRKQHLKFLNANYGGFDEHLPAEGEPLLQIHRSDAAARAIEHGDTVDVFNQRGSLTLTAALSDDLQPGIVAIPFGWWNRHTPNDRGVNALTNPTPPDDDIGSGAFHDTPVQVKRHRTASA